MDKIIISIELTNANDTLLRCFLKNLKGEASVKARSYMKIVSSTFSYKLVEALTVDLASLRETRERIYPRTSSNQAFSLSLQYSRTRFEVNATPWLVEDGVARKIKSIPGGGRETLEAGYGGSYGVGGERVI